jgi:hypothetical protein
MFHVKHGFENRQLRRTAEPRRSSKTTTRSYEVLMFPDLRIGRSTVACHARRSGRCAAMAGENAVEEAVQEYAENVG